MTDRLTAGQEIPKGGRITSANGDYFLAFQQDDNLVLYNRQSQALWSPNIAGQGGVKCILQTDANLVVYGPKQNAIWNAGSQGHPGAYLVLQSDGNIVIYAGSTPVWNSRTWGGHYHEESQGWLANAASCAGRALASVSGEIGHVISSVADLAGNIPLVGDLIQGVLMIAEGPFTFTEDMLRGERIDRALLKDLKSKVAAYQEIAPYAATIVSCVPGIGTGVAAGIAASAALAQGMPIDEAVMVGVKNALPGGPAIKACYDLTRAAVTGQNMINATGDALIQAAGLPPQAKNALNVIYRASKGENIPKAALEEAYNAMPSEDAKRACNVAIAVAQGKRIQDIAREQLRAIGPTAIGKLASIGEKIVVQTPVFQAGKSLIQSPQVQYGYHVGIGLMHHAGVARDTIVAIRKKLKPEHVQGFDVAVSTHVAAVSAPSMLTSEESAAITLDYLQARDTQNYYAAAGQTLEFMHAQQVSEYYLRAQSLAGYLLAYGMRGHPNSGPMMQIATVNAYARAGAAIAVSRIEAQRGQSGFLAWLRRLLGGK